MKYETWLNLYRLVGILLGTGIMLCGAAISIDSNSLILISCFILAAAVFLFMFVATTATTEENKKGNYLFSVQAPKTKTKHYFKPVPPKPKMLTDYKKIKKITA